MNADTKSYTKAINAVARKVIGAFTIAVCAYVCLLALMYVVNAIGNHVCASGGFSPGFTEATGATCKNAKVVLK
jgi:hypothetical protein